MQHKAELKSRDCIQVDVDDSSILSEDSRVSCLIGCSAFLNLVGQLKLTYGKQISQWPIPTGNSHSEILIRELIIKIQGNWHYPYEHEEVCHCRKVSTFTVDQAIISGAHTIEQVSRQTGASTACGTCKPTVEQILAYRLCRRK